MQFDATNARRRLADLDIPVNRRVGRLSGGQRAQVGSRRPARPGRLAVALARRPQLLVLDEPVARLDPLARHEFMATLMAAVADDGLSVLCSSHVIAELERICDYLIVLADGKVQVAADVGVLVETHKILTGPTADADGVSGRLSVVRQWRTGRQTRLRVRTSDKTTLPAYWRAESTNLEELVLSYLRTPGVTVLPGPTSLITSTVST